MALTRIQNQSVALVYYSQFQTALVLSIFGNVNRDMNAFIKLLILYLSGSVFSTSASEDVCTSTDCQENEEQVNLYSKGLKMNESVENLNNNSL